MNAVLKNLTKRNLILNKKRTIVTIIGIILSTAMIVCVSGLVTSFQQTLINATIATDGPAHVYIKDMSREDLLSLEHNRNILNYFSYGTIGYAKYDKSVNEYKPYIYITAFNNAAFENIPLTLISGRMPTNGAEILVSNHALEDVENPYKIGDVITLNVGKRILKEDNLELNQTNPYNALADYLDASEQIKSAEEIIDTKPMTFTVVGIIERPNYTIENYSAPGYTFITYQDKILEKNTVGIVFKDAHNYDKKTKEIAGEYKYSYNSELLRWLGVSNSDTMNALILVAGVVIAIIMVSSVFVIKNSFAISITEKYKMYGMLRSVGATKKQIKKNVLYEGIVLGLIAIPLGILGGLFAVFCLVHVVNFILGDYLDNMLFVFKISIMPILIASLLAMITIYFSTVFSAKRASKISPIEAIRSNNDIKIKRKKLKTPKIIEKLFKTGGVIAYKNLKRNKKKYRTTVISLVVSIVVFVSLSSFIGYGFKFTSLYYQELRYNFYVDIAGGKPEAEQEEAVRKVLALDHITNYAYIKQVHAMIKGNLSDFAKNYYNIYYANDLDEIERSIFIFSVGDMEYKRYLKELGLNPSDYQDKGLLIDEYVYTDDKGKKYIGNWFEFKEKLDIIADEKTYSLEVKRVNRYPIGLENNVGSVPMLIVSDNYLDTNFKEEYGRHIVINSDNPKALEESLDILTKENKDFKETVNYQNVDELIRANNAIVLVISIFLYGFITVISLIGITNIFNTITTNMNLRSKEFAMLKSIGMTKKEFNRMIRLESIFYGAKALIIGLPIGIGGSYLIYLAYKENIDFGFMIPYKAILITIIFVSIIIGIIMKYSFSKINKQNIIETIRNDNI